MFRRTLGEWTFNVDKLSDSLLHLGSPKVKIISFSINGHSIVRFSEEICLFLKIKNNLLRKNLTNAEKKSFRLLKF